MARQPPHVLVQPEYEQRALGEADRQSRLRLLASRDGRGDSVTIHQDVTVYDACLATGDEASYQVAGDRRAWIQVIEGIVTVNDTRLDTGDGAAISEEPSLSVRAVTDAVFMLFDLA